MYVIRICLFLLVYVYINPFYFVKVNGNATLKYLLSREPCLTFPHIKHVYICRVQHKEKVTTLWFLGAVLAETDFGLT